MAGAAMGDGDEAVAVNVTPLIDVIFCLCLFFMCSFHFKQLEGKLDSWLPRDKGNQAGGLASATVDDIVVFIRMNGEQVEMQFGARKVDNIDQLEQLIVQTWNDQVAAGKKDGSVAIDGDLRVPWKNVLAVLDRCKKNKIEKVEFKQPLPTAAAPKPSSG